MNKIPLLEKYKYCNDVEVIKLDKYEFVIKEINHIQSNYLHNYTEYFFKNPEIFVPFLYEIILNKDELDLFLNEGNSNNFFKDSPIRKNKILNLIHAICIQCISIAPISFDYTLANEIKSISENNLLINRFITILITYGYKKNEINYFSNKKIIKLALEELWIRSKSECIIFVGEIISAVKSYKEQLPLSYSEFNELFSYWKDKIRFYEDEQKNAQAKFDFIKNMGELFKDETKTENQNKKNEYTKKSLAELKAEQEEIKRQRNLLNSLPK